MRRSIIALAGAATLLLAALVPAAAAASSSPFSWEDAYTVDHECGIVELVELSVTGRAYFDGNGDWLRDIVRFRYASVFENAAGSSIAVRSNQVAEYTPATGTLRAQGTFIHGGQIGVAFPDVGRIVFDMNDGSTLFATPKVLRFDDPAGRDALDAALCELLG